MLTDDISLLVNCMQDVVTLQITNKVENEIKMCGYSLNTMHEEPSRIEEIIQRLYLNSIGP